ncbi:EAL domain-containing protein [Methylococcus sp. EFPC2]|uniref:bifunctional diguanylate cyclase/phosphodiesterase n=1 Tax=Methylococcus sp. EFPC2 TaxID=2812648 RepID=UPI0019689EA5|nr:EAL domain-containing protein [Methylococcus sp. EFPC2]QSA97277.1 EAL domain-containing protein [Methylococcus sp. EFPC2]
MTLSRLITLLMTLLLLPITVGALAIVAQHNREQWKEQLASHAQDTAIALGLALQPYLAANDLAGAESLVDAIFDGGYYQTILVRAADGSQLIERQANPRPTDVPGWLVAALPLPTPLLGAPIMNGWKQSGMVTVGSHPGYAYRALWLDLWSLGRWFVLGWLASSLLVAAGLRWILASLRTLEDQALRVARLEFTTQKNLPRIRELRRITEALNLLSDKFRGLFSEYSASAESLRELAYRDPLTGLPNARFLQNALAETWETNETRQLMLIQIDGFQALNARLGRANADRILSAAAKTLKRAVKGQSGALLVRLESATFALLAENLGPEPMSRLAACLQAELTDTVASGNGDPPLTACFGICELTDGLTATEALSLADAALRRAQAQGAGLIVSEPRNPQDEQERDLWLKTQLANQTLSLRWQAVADPRRGISLHREAYARLPDADGRLLPAHAFLPFAERNGLQGELDRQVIALVLAELKRADRNGPPCAVNLAAESLADERFVNDLLDALSPRDVGGRLLVETGEAAFLTHRESVGHALKKLRERGVGIGLDRFGRRFADFGYLLDWRPDYLKLDGTLVRRILDDVSGRFYLQSLAHLAHGLNLTLIATQVESEAQQAQLVELGVDGVQGHWVDGLESGGVRSEE